jgi:hypothetical protein
MQYFFSPEAFDIQGNIFDEINFLINFIDLIQ